MEPSPSRRERAEGHENQSEMRFEPPDICVAVFVGDIDGVVMRRMNEELKRAAEGRDHIFFLIDQTRAGSVNAEARRLGVEGARGINILAGAVFGASFHMRVVMTLIVRVLRLVQNQQGNLLQFFATEAEARAYLTERRRALFGELGERD